MISRGPSIKERGDFGPKNDRDRTMGQRWKKENEHDLRMKILAYLKERGHGRWSVMSGKDWDL